MELQLLNENYYIGTPEWSLGFQEAHIYWYDPQSGEQGIEYTVSKENFESPVTLTISNVQHDTFIKIKAHYHDEHDYSAAYDEIIQNGNCTTDSVIRHFCYKCGKTYDETVSADGHVTSSTFEKDNISHWKTCNICGEEIGLETHTPDDGTVTLEPTYDTEGKMEYHCTVCGYSIGETAIAPLGHNVDDEWQSEVSGHWHNCDCGERHNFGGHISDSGTVTLYPTETEEGEREYRCTVCRYVIKTEVIPALGGGSETPSHPDNGIPFIKNENTKNGWNVIKAEAEIAAEGGVITVDMNGTTVVPGYVIDTITGRDVTLVFDMGGDISWSVNRKCITVENVGDTDFLVKKVQ